MVEKKIAFWMRDSSILLGGLLVTTFLVVYHWWSLAEKYFSYLDWNGPWWLNMDWLLIGVFLFMFITIVAHANLKTDLLIVFVGIFGGMAIELWGTQANLWHYYTAERPPLWIIPAWPIASLSTDRITRFLDWVIKEVITKHTNNIEDTENKLLKTSFNLLASEKCFEIIYWITCVSFLIIMLVFVSPTFNKSYTWLAFILCIILILTQTDYRFALLTFIAGAGLGYFLELWGTTRHCWIYYTNETPPFFAVLAHGMAVVMFWRAGLLVKLVLVKLSEYWHRFKIPRFPG